MVYPACAGIDPHSLLSSWLWTSLPRMRGDRPASCIGSSRMTAFTPHARGSTLIIQPLWGVTLVYPACAGIDPQFGGPTDTARGLPRMRGDRPFLFHYFTPSIWFTPHARGSTRFCCRARLCACVYPACAGIDLSPYKTAAIRSSLPRMRGDRP